MDGQLTRNQLLEAFDLAVLKAESVVLKRPSFPLSRDPEADRRRNVETAIEWYESAIKPRVIPENRETVSRLFVDTTLRTLWDDVFMGDEGCRKAGANANTEFVKTFCDYLQKLSV